MGEEGSVAEADLADPNPDMRDLFKHYDRLYFQGALADAGFTVQWGSSLATSSFGSCTFLKPRNTITLSEPVLKYLSCTDRKNALLHEMIHAIIYVKYRRKDRQHGPTFRAWMDAINSCSIKDHQRPVGGYDITTRHDFGEEEPCSFKGYLWKCETCGDTLLRSTNKGPPSDACCIENVVGDASCRNMLCHWHNHKNQCLGSYEKVMLQPDTPVQGKVLKGTQLLQTYPSETSKSQGAIQESNSAALQENTNVTKPNAEDNHLSQISGSNVKSPGSSSSKKAGKRHGPEVVRELSVLPAEPPRKLKPKQALVATEKHELFSPAGCNNAKSLGSNTSKRAGKQHKPEDVHKSIILPVAPLKPKQGLVTSEKNDLSSLLGCSNAKSPRSSFSRKAGKQHKPESAQKACSQPAYPLRRGKQDLVASQKNELFPPMDCINEKVSDRSSSKEAHKQHEPEDIMKTTVRPAPPGSKRKESSNVASEKQNRNCKRKPAREKEFAVMSAWLDYYESDRSSGSTEPLVNKRTERRKRQKARIQTYSRSKKVNSAPLDDPRIHALISSHKIETGLHKDGCPDIVVPTTAGHVATQATGNQPQLSALCLDIVPLQPADPPGLIPPDQSCSPDVIDISDDD